MLSICNIMDFKKYFKEENMEGFEEVLIDEEKFPEKAEEIKREMDNFILFQEKSRERYGYSRRYTRDDDWLKEHFYPVTKLPPITKREIDDLEECSSEAEIQEFKNRCWKSCLYREIFSEYIILKRYKTARSLPQKYRFIFYKGDFLIKRKVFSDKNNILRLYNISRFLALHEFLFYALSLDDFLVTFYGIAIKRFGNIEHIEFDKMKNLLRCQKCHSTTELSLDNFINSNQRTVEAEYKCPKCGEIYSFSKLKKIYEENMRNVY